MNPIKVSDLQESKLLEMCKELYPEYIRIDFRMCCGEDTSDFVYNENLGFLDSNGWTEIHWFEFCMTYLADKIFKDHDNFSNIKDSFITIFSIKDEHPIDYLYEQFKQLKINK